MCQELSRPYKTKLPREKFLSSYAKKNSWHVSIRSCQDLIKVFKEIYVYQDLGKIIQVLQELTRSCMSWQGLSSFVSLGKLATTKVKPLPIVWETILQGYSVMSAKLNCPKNFLWWKFAHSAKQWFSNQYCKCTASVYLLQNTAFWSRLDVEISSSSCEKIRIRTNATYH